MSGDTLLQLFVFLQVFLIGLLATIVIRHGYIHLWPRKKSLEPPPLTPKEESIPPAVKQQLIHSSEAEFQSTLHHSVEQLQRDLQVTTQHINNLVMRVASEVVSGELEKYRAQFEELHKQAQADMGGISAELVKYQGELKTKLTQEIELEKQKLVKQMDTKLGDAVASFLVETLAHNVDLGNQSEYLVSMLEEHKAELIKEVADEPEPAK